MRQYIYSASQANLRKWPEGELRLQHIPITTNPDEADLFVCPGALFLFQKPEDLDRFPYMKGREQKHVFFDVSDIKTVYSKPCIFIRCNTRDWYFKTDPNTISWAWPVEDYKECIDVPDGGFTYDVTFQGWLSSDARIAASSSVKSTTHLRCDIAEYFDFTGYLKADDPELARRRFEFRRSMRESRIALCAESIPGVFPYRFFEAMSAGRVPLLIGSDYVLPSGDKIPYDKFALFLPRDKANEAGAFIEEFLRKTPDDAIRTMGLLARQYWKQYLNSEDWPHTMAAAVVEKMGQLVCA